MDALKQFFASRSLGDYIDLACGEGEFTERLLEVAAGFRSVLGMDLDAESVGVARELFQDDFDNVTFVAGDVHRTGLPDACYDTASISNALHHVREPEVVLRELRRILRPGGLLVVNEMIRDGLHGDQANARDLHHLKARVDRLNGVEHRETYSAEELRRLLGIGADRGRSHSVPIVLLEATEELDADDEETVERRLEFLEGYVEFADQSDEYAAIRKEAVRLKHRIVTAGFRPQPQKLFVLASS